ncbi:MAG: IS110 family transposase [Gemmatimonadetes bacterium]|nr:IS110 family transposase [Gemmatimonadota bacterium]
MATTERFIGIDVAKDEVVVAVWPTGETWASGTRTRDLRGLAKKLAKLTPALVVLEPTGGYELPVLAALDDAALPATLVQPGRVRHFAQATGVLAKTDRLDARTLARYAAQTAPEHWPRPDPARRALLLVLQRRRQLLELLAAEEQRLEQQALFPASPVKPSLERLIAHLREQLADTDGEVRTLVQQHPEWQPILALLQGIPGVGFVVAVSLLAYLPELGQLSRQRIAALIGLAPFHHASGHFDGGRHITGGRAPLRQVLYMAAIGPI